MDNSIIAGEINSSLTGSIIVDNSSNIGNGSISCDPSSGNTAGSYYSYSTNWDWILQNLSSNSIIDNKIDDEEIKRKVSEKINEVLNEDSIIDLMKKYLLNFIEENIDNPENLIKEFLINRDEELNKCKEELKVCKEEIRQLREAILQYPIVNPYYPYLGEGEINHPTTSPTITWTNNTSIV